MSTALMLCRNAELPFRQRSTTVAADPPATPSLQLEALQQFLFLPSCCFPGLTHCCFQCCCTCCCCCWRWSENARRVHASQGLSIATYHDSDPDVESKVVETDSCHLYRPTPHLRVYHSSELSRKLHCSCYSKLCYKVSYYLLGPTLRTILPLSTVLVPILPSTFLILSRE
jgi:hypothetical protein